MTVDQEPLRYYSQGPHDGLCGFFAVLNAVRFMQQQVDHPFAREDDGEFFDEAVEALARVAGVNIRVLKSNPAIGDIDQFQVRDLAVVFAERIALPVVVTLVHGYQKMPFASRYRKLLAMTDAFAVIVPYHDYSHWITIVSIDRTSFSLIDEGEACTIALRGGDGPRLANDVSVVLTTT